MEPQDLAPGITVLQLFLSSPRPTVRYAAIKTLSEVAVVAPMAVVKVNDDMEMLISDPNRSIATLAITTLLKTGSEQVSAETARHQRACAPFLTRFPRLLLRRPSTAL